MFNSYFHITRPGNPPIEIAGEKPTRTVLVRRQVTVFMFSIQMASTGPSKSTWVKEMGWDFDLDRSFTGQK